MNILNTTTAAATAVVCGVGMTIANGIGKQALDEDFQGAWSSIKATAKKLADSTITAAKRTFKVVQDNPKGTAMIGAAATTTVVALVYRNAIGSAVVAKSKTVASFTSSFMTKTSAVLASVTATGLGASLKSSGNKASVAIKA